MAKTKKKSGGGLGKVRVSFKSVQNMTLKEVYGNKPIKVTQLAKDIWKLIKKKNLRVS